MRKLKCKLYGLMRKNNIKCLSWKNKYKKKGEILILKNKNINSLIKIKIINIIIMLLILME